MAMLTEADVEQALLDSPLGLARNEAPRPGIAALTAIDKTDD